MPPFPEGRDVNEGALGVLPHDEVLLFHEVDLAWTTTLPSGHRAFVFWSDCADDRQHDRYHVYTFKDTRFDAAYKKMVTDNELVRPVLETCDWTYVVEYSEGHFLKARVVQWDDLDQTAIPTNEARLRQESDDAKKA